MSARFWPMTRGHIITSGFGARWGTTHWGTDFGRDGGSANLPVFAVQGGTVIMVGPASGFGQWVVLDHPAGDGGGTTVYGHVLPEVTLGQRVEAGQRIARINPDSTTNGGVAPHLHLEWHRYVWVPVVNGKAPDRLDPVGMLHGAAYPGETPSLVPDSAPQGGDIQWGLDLSNHQGDFDFAQARREGFTWVTHKVTEGSWRDPKWPRAREQMREHFPGAFGGYVYCHVENDPQREADWLLDHLGDPSIPVQIDYEDLDGKGVPSVADLVARVDAYLARGVTLLPIYIPRWYWRDRMGAGSLAPLRDRGLTLWNSDYVNGSDVASRLYPGDGYKGWAPFAVDAPDIAFLQFSEKGKVAGQSVDVNAYRGSEAQLRAIFFGKPTPEEDDLTPEQAQMLAEVHRELTQRHPSRSLYRHTSEPIDTVAGFAINADARAHEALVEVRQLAAKVDELTKATPAPGAGTPAA
ncbi:MULTISPECIES: peptidoglycan DD-metalloendopeptidase family protein [Rhodococcus]|uniref:peptidoglycan DD-metalloendopeptidase family protein n=1 Tax=Rhodococcus TaxID=1827 RepID=UPI002585976F|nr:peptidoglycan DD-metalloendopeptidase family protein [Rhodococcus sp. (in: high G+C Gram-positive bacteria)]